MASSRHRVTEVTREGLRTVRFKPVLKIKNPSVFACDLTNEFVCFAFALSFSLVQHGVDPPFVHMPWSPAVCFQHVKKKKGKKQKYEALLTLKDSKDKKKTKSCS